jgi:alkaline phosphatase D
MKGVRSFHEHSLKKKQKLSSRDGGTETQRYRTENPTPALRIPATLHSCVRLFLFVFVVTAASAQENVLRSGPMVGYAEQSEVMLWVQTTRPAKVQLRYWPVDHSADARLSALVQTAAAGDHIARFLLTELPPGTRFNYELYLDGVLTPRPYRLAFQTQPHWQWRTDPPAFTVAFGSCAYINEPVADRPGKPYGSDYEIFSAIDAQQPDLMLWLGDNTYYREPDWYSEAGMRHRYAHTRSLPELQALLGATHNYAIWDDHDYGPNDADRSYRMKQTALEIFKDYWANPNYGVEGVPGVFMRFEWADIEFFMLDDRYHRSPNDMPDSSDKVMFGEQQMRWLMESLVNSRAPFKIIAGGNQMLNPLNTYESFAAYPREQQQFLLWLQTQKVPGVLFLSGDIHQVELIKITPKEFYPFYDFTSSSLTAGLNTRNVDNPARVSGTLVNDMHSFGLLRFAGPRTERRVTLECYDKDGKKRWQHEIAAKELRPPEVKKK